MLPPKWDEPICFCLIRKNARVLLRARPMGSCLLGREGGTGVSKELSWFFLSSSFLCCKVPTTMFCTLTLVLYSKCGREEVGFSLVIPPNLLPSTASLQKIFSELCKEALKDDDRTRYRSSSSSISHCKPAERETRAFRRQRYRMAGFRPCDCLRDPLYRCRWTAMVYAREAGAVSGLGRLCYST